VTIRDTVDKLIRSTGATPPVDRTQRRMTDGAPEDPNHREIGPDGMQKGYIVLSEEERARGFVRPVRRTYKHLTCGGTTTMSIPFAETYARDPHFYAGAFCVHCRAHFTFGQPNGDFVWDGTDEKLGA